jgi:hypothetical protein
MSALELASVVRRSDSHIAAEIGDQLVMMSIEHGSYLALNPMGAEIWARLARPVAVATLCQELLAIFDVEPQTCRDEVLAFLDELRREGLIVEADAVAA